LRYDPNAVGLKEKLLKSSGLNRAEIGRVNKQIFDDGYLNNEKFNNKIDRTIYEEKSGYMVHVIYIWRIIPDKDDDSNRFLRYVHIKRLKRKKIRRYK